MAGLTIGKFAAAEGVGVETVRFYHRRGLLALPERQGSGYREYSEADRWRLAFIRRASRLGFTLGENPQTARRYGIMLVPTLNLFRGGEVVKQVIGARSRSALMREFAEFL